MLDWNDLQYLLALQRQTTLYKAAEALGVNRTTVARRIEQLEEKLGSKLVQKAGRELILTSAGQEAVAAAEVVEGELHNLERRVFGRDQQLAGVIRLTAPPGLSSLLAPELSNFQTENPDVSIEISATNSVEDLEMMESDVAIRMTHNPPDLLVGKIIATPRTAYYADLETAAKLPDLLTVNSIGSNLLPDQTTQLGHLALKQTIVASSMELIRELIIAGHGIGALPCYMAGHDLRLQQVSDARSDKLPPIWLLYHPRLRTQLRIRKFIEHLNGSFERLKPIIEAAA